MRREVTSFLDEVRAHLHLDPHTSGRVISELSTHFEEKVSDLQQQGVAEAEAARSALRSFGDARSIARLLDEAHSGGSWTEALIGCQPHLIVAALFATHVWRHPLLLGAAFAAIAVIAMLGWRSGGASWMYSWIGYAVLPLLVLSYLSMDPVARTFSFVVSGHGAPAPLWELGLLAALYTFTLWVIASTAVAIARTDWILLSLMLLPLPVMGLWIFTVTQSAGVLVNALRSIGTRFSMWDTAMGYFFALLGVTTALFVRVRQRALKIGAVIAVGIVGGALAARSFWGSLGLLPLLAICLCLLLFLTVPLFLRSMLRHDPRAENPLPSGQFADP
ncbi:MAG: permease prefix domain 1-containing protein [Spirochaetia bacterium]